MGGSSESGSLILYDGSIIEISISEETKGKNTLSQLHAYIGDNIRAGCAVLVDRKCSHENTLAEILRARRHEKIKAMAIVAYSFGSAKAAEFAAALCGAVNTRIFTSKVEAFLWLEEQMASPCVSAP